MTKMCASCGPLALQQCKSFAERFATYSLVYNVTSVVHIEKIYISLGNSVIVNMKHFIVTFSL